MFAFDINQRRFVRLILVPPLSIVVMRLFFVNFNTFVIRSFRSQWVFIGDFLVLKMKYVAFHVEKVILLGGLLEVIRVYVLFFLVWSLFVVVLTEDVLFAMVFYSITVLLACLSRLVFSFAQKYVVFYLWIRPLLLHLPLLRLFG